METYEVISLIIIIIVIVAIFLLWYFFSDPNAQYKSDGQELLEDFLGVKFDGTSLEDDVQPKDKTKKKTKKPRKKKSILKPPRDIEAPEIISEGFLFSDEETSDDELCEITNDKKVSFVSSPSNSLIVNPLPANSKRFQSIIHPSTNINKEPEIVTSSYFSKCDKKSEVIINKKDSFSDKKDTHTDKNRVLSSYEYYEQYKDKFTLIVPKKREYTVQEINFYIKGIRMNANQSKGEGLCRQVFQEIFGLRFPTVRPDILENPETGHNLEFDGYNPVLKIAFEYSGIQHYEFPNPFHKTEEEFIEQLRKDRYKREVADQEGIYLIVIPYTVPLNYKEIYKFILFYLPENVEYRRLKGL